MNNFLEKPIFLLLKNTPRPRFELGFPPRKGGILDRTILPGQLNNKMKVMGRRDRVGPRGFEPQTSGFPRLVPKVVI